MNLGRILNTPVTQLFTKEQKQVNEPAQSTQAIVVRKQEEPTNLPLGVTAKQVRQFASHVSHFLQLNSAVDLLPLFQHSQHTLVKDIALAWSLFQAVVNNLRNDTRKGKVRIVVIGEGHTAKIGALFAYMTKWNVISISDKFGTDPTCGVRVDRLQTFGTSIDNISVTDFDEHLIIIMPHTNVEVDKVLDKLRSTRYRSLVLVPPSNYDPYRNFPQTNKMPLVYRDGKMLTEENRVVIYKKI